MLRIILEKIIDYCKLLLKSNKKKLIKNFCL